MSLIVNKLKYNLIKKELSKIEDCYKQSNDIKIRNCVKEMAFYKLCDAIPSFEELFIDAFTACDMSSLYKLDKLYESVWSEIKIEELPQVDLSTVKKLFRKLQEKEQRAIVAGYNEALKNTNLVYYTQSFNSKKVILYYDNGQFEGYICETRPNVKGREMDCHFCHAFRRGSEIEYVSKIEKGKNGVYNSRTVTCCSDYKMCNEDLLNIDPLKDFLKIGESKNEKNRYRTELGD